MAAYSATTPRRLGIITLCQESPFWPPESHLHWGHITLDHLQTIHLPSGYFYHYPDGPAENQPA